MSKKVMLITGASRGIGKSIYEKYKDEYDCITVQRSSGATIRGDLIDWKFREKLINDINPDVFINNAGMYGSPLHSLALNGIAATHLMIGFHKKMSKGHIIAISSLRSSFQGFEIGTKSYENIAYNCAKSMTTSCSVQLSMLKTKPINVVCIEPGIVKTDLVPNIKDPVYVEKDQWINTVYTPLSTDDIVNTVDWVLKQPPWINLSLIKVNSNSIYF
jgi:NADP-dependent 3-hydroxy acid dehydrogenase YdfG